jgi:NADH-quinone oxidoreductase subunit C
MVQKKLKEDLEAKASQWIVSMSNQDMLTLEVAARNVASLCECLCQDDLFQFTTLIDLCCVDYSDYGVSYWRQGSEATTGYNRGVVEKDQASTSTWERERFVVVYHLLSLHLNQRIRLKVFLADDLGVHSVVKVWPAANWYEREAFDLFGVNFIGHPDLRRIMTDYNFKGHPFRKDFPLIGEVEMRYDAKQEACVYEPVSIQPRVLTPKVIRTDSRYIHCEEEESNPHG